MIKFLLLTLSLIKFCLTISLSGMNSLKFFEEPVDTYLTKSQPAVLKCKIENARTGFFKCNDQWSQDMTQSRLVQIGNKQLLTIEHTITKSQLDEFKKLALLSNSESIPSFWCTCQGWLNSADDTIISQKVFIKLAYIHQNFEWEPMPTSGLIGKSVEIRCLPPEGEPKPIVYWLKNGLPIEKSNKRILVSHEGSLLINEVRSSDSANYTCVAENLAGKRFSDAALLTVSENKGWSEWSNWTECSSLSTSNCGEGVQKRFRTCNNPPTINNAIGCDGFPTQTISCYLPCRDNNLLVETENLLKNEKKSISHYSSKLKTNEIGNWWTQWSAWSMVCNNDCLRSRKRECKTGYLLPNGKVLPINDEKLLIGVKLEKCSGPDIDYSNCTFFCNKVSNETPAPILEKNPTYPNFFLIATLVILLVLFTISILFFLIRRKKNSKIEKEPAVLPGEIHPIYYSVQADFSQDSYMDNLLPNQLNPNMYGYESAKLKPSSKININPHFLNANFDDRCNTSRNSSTTTTSASNSTTSSKVKLTASPTDSMGKSRDMSNHNNSNNYYVCCSTLNKNYYQTEHHPCIQLDHDYENNAYQIMKLINEQKTYVYQAKCSKLKNNYTSELDLYDFSLYKSGGIIDIPKYSMNILIPDDVFLNDINCGIIRTNNENILNLTGNQTLLSSIFLIKTNQTENYSKPLIFSMDHSGLFIDTDWETSIFFKALNSTHFEEVNQNLENNQYSQVVSNRFYLLSQQDGFFALVGRPKSNNSIKEMKYAILLIDDEIKVYIIQNTKGANEILNEQIQKTNGKIIKMPELFELNYPKKSKLENSYLNLELNVVYNNLVINSDSTCRKIRMCDIWNSSADFIEIQIPFSLNEQVTKQLKQSLNYKLSNQNLKPNEKINFDLKVSLELEDKLLFSYSNLNTNISELHTANCNQQEFYSSVSVNPVFIPLKITTLLDEYFSKCFKMNSLKRNDWKLFASLVKCDRNSKYFSFKENSFELIISLWLMINLNRSDNHEEGLTVNLINCKV